MTEEIDIETAVTPADTDETGGLNNPPLQSAIERRIIPSGGPGMVEPPKEHVIKQSNSIEQESKPNEKLAELESALNETRKSLAARIGDYDRLKVALDDTVSAYRKLAVSSSPLYSDDMISGSTVEEIDASIKKVNGLIKKMRSTLEAEFKDLSIPAGAPERSAPDLTGLSPRDKIKYGIQEKK